MRFLVLAQCFPPEHDRRIVILEGAQDGAQRRLTATILPKHQSELLECHVSASRSCHKTASRTCVLYLRQRHLTNRPHPFFPQLYRVSNEQLQSDLRRNAADLFSSERDNLNLGARPDRGYDGHL